MSNCAKLFGATVFFVLATVTSSIRSDDISTFRHISFVNGCIEKRARLLERLIININSLPSDVNYVSVINELTRNMTEDANEIRFTIDVIINDPKNTHAFDKTECKQFLVDYEKETESILGRLNNKTSDALKQTTEALQHVLDETNKALDQKIKPLKSAAQTCEGWFCNSMRNDADATLRYVFGLTSKFVCTDRKEISYMRIIVQMEKDFFVQNGIDVVKKTGDCVYGKKSSGDGSVHIQIDF